MNRSLIHILAVAALAAVLSVVSLRAQQGTESFAATHMADLRSFNETAPIGDSARGIVFMRYGATNRMLRYRITVAGLSGITVAHFHRGAAGEDGPPVFSITGLTDSTTTATGVWSMSQGEADSLLAGQIYINVHTSSHTSGNIRGQVIPMPNFFAPGISAQQEVGHTVNDTLGYGEALFTLDPVAKRLHYVVRWDGLSGPATNAHFHLGSFGVAGPVLHTINLASGRKDAYGIWTLNDSLVAHLQSGNIYLNIHTGNNPLGEIRGQLVMVYTFTAAIAPENEVPNRADSSDGTGSGFAVVAILRGNPFSAVLGGQAFGGGATGPITAVHIHMAGKGVNGPVFQGLTPDTSGYVWEIPSGTTRFVTADTFALFLGQGAYLNFHTARFNLGEMRGQLVPASTNLPVPTGSTPVDPAVREGMNMRGELRDGRLHFTLDNVADADTRIILYNILGAEVVAIPLQGTTTDIDAASLTPGLYLARLVTNQGTVGVCSVMVVR